MTLPRYAAKRDFVEPQIVEALEAIGCTVYRELPSDLLVRHPSYGPGMFKVLECKTPRGKKGKAVLDKRQVKQIEFLEHTGTPRVVTPEEAIHAVTMSLAEAQR